MNDILSRICADKMCHVASQQSATPLDILQKAIKTQETPRGFIKHLNETSQAGDVALIAEVKKASPSKGVIREDFDPVTIARAYETAGATCLSVLTDTPYFQGQDSYLQEIKQAVTLPLLRKDFMLTPYQIHESRALGADCILLIMAALEDQTAKELYDLAKELGMDVLVEVHDSNELERAMALNPDMIGVNSRNLKTLEVNIQTAHDLIRQMPSTVLKIAESGIHSHKDIKALTTSGAQAFLVGESLMRQENIIEATKNLLGTN